MLAALAWRNIWRQPHRTLLSLASIVLAGLVTVFIFALQQGSYAMMKESVLRLMDGFAQVQPRGYSDDPDLHKAIAGAGDLAAKLTRVPGVTAAAPRAETYVILSNDQRSYGAAVFGVDPRRERDVSVLGRTISQGRYLDAQDGAAIVLGAALARNLGLKVGDKVTLLGSARDGTVAADMLTLVGIFASGTSDLDRQVAEIPLARFQADFAMEGLANVIVLTGKHLNNVESALPQLREIARDKGLVVRDWKSLEPGLHDAILLDMSFSLLLYASLIIIVVFIILNTLLMSVLERTREFGMLLAIGMRPGQIGQMIWLELIMLAVVGAVLGAGLGYGITAWIAGNGITFPGAEALFAQWHMPATLYPQLDALSALAGPLAIAVAIIIAGIVPYLRIRRLQPVSAMRAS